MKSNRQIKAKLKSLQKFSNEFTLAKRPTPAIVIGLIESLEWVLED